jgi:hypothetical protein
VLRGTEVRTLDPIFLLLLSVPGGAMGAEVDFLIVIGGMLILVGGGMALVPDGFLRQNDDGKPIPPTPANVRWTRILGVALVVLGVVLVCAGIVGVKGADDPVLF